ncbi:MAG: hypothetical protein IPL39_03135 [Opitutaceae bacterium]|nr:hypothetical protein [Opitutaceae bacterium]
MVESEEGIVACGGVDQWGDLARASFAFGMVERRLHGRGIRTLLVLARLALVDCSDGEITVFLTTAERTEGFYRRFGFKVSDQSEFTNDYGGGLYYQTFELFFTQEMRAEVGASLRSYGPSLVIDYESLGGPSRLAKTSAGAEAIPRPELLPGSPHP